MKLAKTKKPVGFEDSLGGFGEQLFDGNCGKPIGWGFKIIEHLGELRFNQLSNFGELECCYPDWYLITKFLTKKKAETLYGKMVIEYGPRGGFKSVTFGETRFISKHLDFRK